LNKIVTSVTLQMATVTYSLLLWNRPERLFFEYQNKYSFIIKTRYISNVFVWIILDGCLITSLRQGKWTTLLKH